MVDFICEAYSFSRVFLAENIRFEVSDRAETIMDGVKETVEERHQAGSANTERLLEKQTKQTNKTNKQRFIRASPARVVHLTNPGISRCWRRWTRTATGK